MGWLWLVGSIKSRVSFATEPYQRDNILQKRPTISWILKTVAALEHARGGGLGSGRVPFSRNLMSPTPRRK